MLAESAIHGQDTRAGRPVTAIARPHTRPAAANWPHSAMKRSSLTFTRRFQPAWSAAAARAKIVARTMARSAGQRRPAKYFL
jgi:hypothetical protein